MQNDRRRAAHEGDGRVTGDESLRCPSGALRLADSINKECTRQESSQKSLERRRSVSNRQPDAGNRRNRTGRVRPSGERGVAIRGTAHYHSTLSRSQRQYFPRVQKIMMKIRLARGGAKKRPFYHVVATDSRSSRDGKFVERLGYYNPNARGQEQKLVVDAARIAYWQQNGAQISERVAFLVKGVTAPAAV